MLNRFLVSHNLSFGRYYHVIFIFFGVFTAGTVVYNAENALSITMHDSVESSYLMKLEEPYQPKFISIDSQVEPSVVKISSDNPTLGSGSIDSITVSADSSESEFRQDVAGKYTNPQYGITEFEIPVGWYATESMNGNSGIILTMLPGTTEEFFTKLNSLSNNETLPILNLVVQDKDDLRERQMSSSLSGPSSFSTDCAEITPNSTSTINDKQFQISTMECSTADKAPIAQGIDFSHEEITKSYKYDTPATMYILQLVLSSEYSSNKTINYAYLSKFQPVIDNAIQTLKIR
jgi:hypothetical protein